MVLKRPYGLMIKHFKLIHLVLLLLSSYVLWQLRPLVGFYNEFVAGGYTATIVNNMASNYINSIIYFCLILMFVILIMLIILLRFKKKPTNIYTFALVYYIILFIAIIISATLLNGLEESLWSTTAARMYRDIATMITIPQYIFLPFWFIRALGFNVKQFNFQGDLAELDLSQADSEEIEINIGFETYKAKRIFHRFIREFRYYYSENKFVMIIILAITILLLVYLFFSNYQNNVVKYNVGQSFNFSNLEIKVEDSIITNLNYAGDKLNNYYLLLKITIANNNEKSMPFDYNKFLIYSDKNYYKPQISESNKFIDYGESYFGTEIKSKTERTIIIPYIIEQNDLNSSYHLGIYTGVNKVKDDYKFKTINVKLTPAILDDVTVLSKIKLNQALDLNSTYLNNTILTIKNAKIYSSYTYEYEECINNNCGKFKDIITPSYSTSPKQTLLVLDYDLTLDFETPYAKGNNTINSFANNFFKVQYTIDKENFVTTVKNLTPTNLKNQFVLQVTDDINKANQVDLVVTIRNKSYVINLI